MKTCSMQASATHSEHAQQLLEAYIRYSYGNVEINSGVLLPACLLDMHSSESQSERQLEA